MRPTTDLQRTVAPFRTEDSRPRIDSRQLDRNSRGPRSHVKQGSASTGTMHGKEVSDKAGVDRRVVHRVIFGRVFRSIHRLRLENSW